MGYITCIGNDILSITRLLKKYNLNIAFKTNNTPEKYLTKARCNNTDTGICDTCGIYRLKCSSYVGVYVGQNVEVAGSDTNI
jgi:hypothetical protein